VRSDEDDRPVKRLISCRLLVTAVALGLTVSVWIVLVGGPSDRLTATWVFGFKALVVGVVVAEILTIVLERLRHKAPRDHAEIALILADELARYDRRRRLARFHPLVGKHHSIT
jgi:hypothetical protein